MPHLHLKRKISWVWPAQYKSRKIILLYHSVGSTPWGMHPEMFSEQINWLTDNCEVLSLTDLIQAKPNKEVIQVAITFDDGYTTLYNQVAAKLKQKNISATVYLNTGWISEDENVHKSSEAKLGHYPDEFFLSWKEVKELYKAGWEIGSHGVNHYNFSLTEPKITRDELIQSKKTIEKNINSECIHFSYPWGRYNANLKKIVAIAGYQYAVAALHSRLVPSSDSFALPRINIAKEYSLADFKQIVKGKWDYLGFIQKAKGL